MRLNELIRQSWDALTRNRLRSILTMMGIVWGLTTVVLLLGYGQSVSAGVLNAFLGIGNNVIMVWEDQTSMQAGGERAGKRIHFKSTTSRPFVKKRLWSDLSARNGTTISLINTAIEWLRSRRKQCSTPMTKCEGCMSRKAATSKTAISLSIAMC